ncbi:MAG: PAS domain S-box protein [Caldilineaceae bacterium]
MRCWILDGDWNEEFRILHPERGERWLVGIGQVAYDEAGNATRFTGVNLDITERKVIEAQLRYQAYLLNNVQDAIISTDLEFRIRSWNRGAEQVYGWSAAEAVGRNGERIVGNDLCGGRHRSIRSDRHFSVRRALAGRGHPSP